MLLEFQIGYSISISSWKTITKLQKGIRGRSVGSADLCIRLMPLRSTNYTFPSFEQSVSPRGFGNESLNANKSCSGFSVGITWSYSLQKKYRKLDNRSSLFELPTACILCRNYFKMMASTFCLLDNVGSWVNVAKPQPTKDMIVEKKEK